MHEARHKNEQFASKIRQKQRHNIRKPPTQPQPTPLTSLSLRRFWEIDHQHIWKYIPEIEAALVENPLLPGQDEEQQTLIKDIFYLTMEQPEFRMPRNVCFLRNGSPLVASLVALVSLGVKPNELAYWLGYMSDEDKQIVYLEIIEQSFHYLSWINQPSLKHWLMSDFMTFEPAAQAVKNIVGYREVNPSYFVTTDGIGLEQRLQTLIQKQMQQEPQSNKGILLPDHMEVAIWVLAKALNFSHVSNLCQAFNKAIAMRPFLITSLFIQWVCKALKLQPSILNEESLRILIGIVESKMSELYIPQNVKSEQLSFLFERYQQKVNQKTDLLSVGQMGSSPLYPIE